MDNPKVFPRRHRGLACSGLWLREWLGRNSKLWWPRGRGRQSHGNGNPSWLVRTNLLYIKHPEYLTTSPLCYLLYLQKCEFACTEQLANDDPPPPPWSIARDPRWQRSVGTLHMIEQLRQDGRTCRKRPPVPVRARGLHCAVSVCARGPDETSMAGARSGSHSLGRNLQRRLGRYHLNLVSPGDIVSIY